MIMAGTLDPWAGFVTFHRVFSLFLGATTFRIVGIGTSRFSRKRWPELERNRRRSCARATEPPGRIRDSAAAESRFGRVGCWKEGKEGEGRSRVERLVLNCGKRSSTHRQLRIRSRTNQCSRDAPPRLLVLLTARRSVHGARWAHPARKKKKIDHER